MTEVKDSQLRTNTEIALEFLRQVASGTIDDAILSSDFSGWTAAFGEVSGDDFRKGVSILTRVLKEPLRTTPTGITAQGERVAVEAISEGTLITGEYYSNNYHFLVVVKNGRVSRVKAYFNTLEATTRLSPLFNAADPGYLNRVSAAASGTPVAGAAGK